MVVSSPADVWSPERAREWAGKQPWMVGCNFAPSTAVNQLEMWQADTFDPDTIDVLRHDGTPFSEKEIAVIREVTAAT